MLSLPYVKILLFSTYRSMATLVQHSLSIKIILMLILCYAIFAQSSHARYPGAYGDPHFTGWDAVNFDFTGEPGGIYCMISDASLHINMKLGGRLKLLNSYGHTKPQTWIKSLGILYRGHRIIMAAGEGEDLSHKQSFMASIAVNGEEVGCNMIKEGDGYKSLDNGVMIRYEKRESNGVMPYDSYSVVLGDEAVLMKVKAGPEVPEEREPGRDAFLHLSVEVVGGGAELTGGVHGVLGQTLLNARGRLVRGGGGSYKTAWNPLLVQQQVDGPNGEGYLDGSVSDYASSGLLHSDCRFSRFNPNLIDNRSTPIASVTVSSGYSRRRFLPGASS